MIHTFSVLSLQLKKLRWHNDWIMLYTKYNTTYNRVSFEISVFGFTADRGRVAHKHRVIRVFFPFFPFFPFFSRTDPVSKEKY